MSFDRERLAALIAQHGAVARVLVAEVKGSSPREPGASMTVWSDGQDGTIGGGTLEWQAAEEARAALLAGRGSIARYPLGPALGQCCGGAVTLVTELFFAAPQERILFARPLPGTKKADPPLSIRRRMAMARAEGVAVGVMLTGGWIAEPVAAPVRDIRIYGAGHVGLAIARVLAPLQGLSIHLIDDRPDRFDGALPDTVHAHLANPTAAVAYAPDHAEHLVLTYSHALDLEICHRILGRSFVSAGLIGSASKARRFRTRLAALGHAAGAINRIKCPIGDPTFGKEPQAIAISVAHDLIASPRMTGFREALG